MAQCWNRNSMVCSACRRVPNLLPDNPGFFVVLTWQSLLETTKMWRCPVHLTGPLLLASFSTLYAQSTKAELFGIVRDPSRLPVNAATVELTNSGTGAKLSVESDSNGSYHFFALTAGNYQISVVKTGFTA